jgi:hypothetical protein
MKIIEHIRSKWKKKQQDSQKRKNLATTNCTDFKDIRSSTMSLTTLKTR